MLMRVFHACHPRFLDLSTQMPLGYIAGFLAVGGNSAFRRR